MDFQPVGGKVKRIPPSAIGLDLTCAAIDFSSSGTFFFTVMLLERLGKLMMLIKGGMRYAFPPYVLKILISIF